MKKRLLSLLLIVLMVTSLVACGDKKAGGNKAKKDGNTETSEEGKIYTWHDIISSGINSFSPTDWQASNESTIMNRCLSALYDFRLDLESEKEYKIVPEMATQMPEDVTAEFAGNEKYGVPADVTEGWAWRVTIRKDMTWDDGTPITTHDYEYSLKQYLNPDMKNYRASSYSDGEGALANAVLYYSGSTFNAGEKKHTFDELEKTSDGTYAINGKEVRFGWTVTNNGWLGGRALADCATDSWPELSAIKEQIEAMVDGKGYFPVNDETIELLYGATSVDNWGNETKEDLINYMYYDDPDDATPWEDVGFIADDDYTFTVVLTQPLSEFYFLYHFSSIDLVKEDLYEANKKETGGLIKSSYGTSVETFASYGPYKLVEYQEGKFVRFEKNEGWFGYTDGNHEGLYQTTNIEYQMIEDHSTILSLFLQGKLESVGLTSEDIAEYGTSDYVFYEPGQATTEFGFNTSFDALKSREEDGINKTILTYRDFRKAISLSLDRAEYCKTCTAGAAPAYGLIGELYIYNPEEMAKYRDTDVAKKVLCEVYDVNDVSELTGYNREEASKLIQSAYDQCYADGNIKDGDVVSIDYHIYGSDNQYQKQVDFVDAALKDAAVGTSLEGRIEVKLVADQDYYTSMQNGLNDMIREGWQGAAMNPYGYMGCYTSQSYILEYGFYDTFKTEITVNGVTEKMSVGEWQKALESGKYATADYDTRNQVLAGLEKAILTNYHVIPLYGTRYATLYAHRVILPVDHYVNNLVGSGSLSEITYSMDDAEWEKYCADHNNQLEY